MSGDEVIQTTEREILMREKQAVLSSKVKAVEELIPEIFTRIKSVDEQHHKIIAGIGDIPMQIIKCRDDMDASTKKWAHDVFITEKELIRFESKLEGKVATELSKVTMKINKAVWVITWVYNDRDLL